MDWACFKSDGARVSHGSSVLVQMEMSMSGVIREQCLTIIYHFGPLLQGLCCFVLFVLSLLLPAFNCAKKERDHKQVDNQDHASHNSGTYLQLEFASTLQRQAAQVLYTREKKYFN